MDKFNLQNKSEALNELSRIVDTLENVSTSIERLADRQRVSVTASKIIAHVRLTTSLTRIYKVPLSTVACIKEIFATNITGTARTFDLYVVPPPTNRPAEDGTPADTDILYYTESVSAGNEYVEQLELALEQGWEIHVLSSADDALNMHISGIELVTL